MRTLMRMLGMLPGETTERTNTPIEYDEYVVSIVKSSFGWRWEVRRPGETTRDTFSRLYLSDAMHGNTDTYWGAKRAAHKAIRNDRRGGTFKVKVRK